LVLWWGLAGLLERLITAKQPLLPFFEKVLEGAKEERNERGEEVEAGGGGEPAAAARAFSRGSPVRGASGPPHTTVLYVSPLPVRWTEATAGCASSASPTCLHGGGGGGGVLLGKGLGRGRRWCVSARIGDEASHRGRRDAA